MNAASYAAAVSALSAVVLVIEVIVAVVVGLAARRANVHLLLGGFVVLTVLARIAPLVWNLAGSPPASMSVTMFVVYAGVPQVLSLLSVLCLLGAVYVAAAGDRTPRVQYPSTGQPGQYPMTGQPGQYPSATNPFPERDSR